LGERLLCKQEVIGSIPIGSTRLTGFRGSSSARTVHKDSQFQAGVRPH